MNKKINTRNQRALLPALCGLLGGVVLIALLTNPTPLWAFGFGKLESASFLGEPLNLRIPLISRADDLLAPECFAVKVPNLERSGRDVVDAARLKVEVVRDGSGTALRVSSQDSVVEPAFFVTADWLCGTTGLVVREYTVLLDPRGADPVTPATSAAPAPVPTTATQTGSRAPAQASAGSTAALSDEATNYQVRSGDTLWGIAQRLVPNNRRGQNELIDAIVTNNPTVFPSGDANRLPAGARLQIPGRHEISELAAAAPGRATAPTSADSAQAKAAVDQARRDRRDSPAGFRLKLATALDTQPKQDPLDAERLLEMEEQYKREAELRERIASLQSRLQGLTETFERLNQQAESMDGGKAGESSAAVTDSTAPASQTPAPAPVTAEKIQTAPASVESQAQFVTEEDESLLEKPIFWIALLGTFSLGIVVTRFAIGRSRREAEEAGSVEDIYAMFGDEEGPQPTRATAVIRPPAADETDVASESDMVVASAATETAIKDMVAAAEPAAVVARPSWLPEFKRHYIPERRETERKASVKEVADVLMQAETNLFIDRPEGAIDILRDRIEVFPEYRDQPKLWLLLLQIYRQFGLKEEFSDLSEHFRAYFNIDPPAWGDTEANAAEASSLENNFPHIMNYIISHWRDPGENAADLVGWIEKLLYDDRGGERKGFALQVADDLMMLRDTLRIEHGDDGTDMQFASEDDL